MVERLKGEQVFTNSDVGGPVFVYVRDGKIVRIRPIVFGPDDPSSWSIKVGDKTFSPPRKTTLPPYSLASRQRVYSEKRIKHPLIREDFDPKGKRNPENRGRSKYLKISWDEALDIIAEEIERIRKKYGPSAITATTSSHHMWGNFGYRFSAFLRFFNMLGHTFMFHNPDSWEGWHWGAMHVFGFYWRLGIPDQYDLLEDALKNTELIVFWSNDPDSTRATYAGQESAIWRVWLKKLGKKMVFIDPFYNYTAAILADKWIAPRPGTDSALALAIAYVWLTEGTYDKEYVKTHTFGFDKWADYVLGKEDGIPKTPKWAEEITGVSARIIRALAREWASKKTMLSAGSKGGWGGACRQAYGHEWARMMVLLQAMQGYGKPGVNIWGTTMGAPQDEEFKFSGYTLGGMSLPGVANKIPTNSVAQKVYRLLFPDAILNPPIHWKGEGFCGQYLEQQFKPYTYPAPDGAPIRMFYRYGAAYISTMTNTNRWIQAYQSPNLEFVVNQSPWMEGEAKFADIVLPACTNYEREDVSEFSNITGQDQAGYSLHSYIAVNHRVIVYQMKCIEPLYESKPDYEIFTLLAERLGFKEEYTEGRTVDEWLERIFLHSDLPKYLTWEEFKKRGYFVVPFPEDHKPKPALRWFYEKGAGLATPSGKIEFFSQSLYKFDPNDTERPPVPRYIPSWEGHESDLAKKYPLQLISPHPRFSFHTQHDLKTPWLNEIRHHRVYKDGYFWWPIRINPKDAEARGIKNDDIVLVYNDRGAVLCIAQVTERVRPGTVHSFESCGDYEPIEPAKPGAIDKAGCVNLLSPSRLMSKNAPGMANNSCLVEIKKWEPTTK